MSRGAFVHAVADRHAAGQGKAEAPSVSPIIGSATSIVCRDLMQQTGSFFPKAHVDADAMTTLAIAGHEVLGFDNVMPLFSVCHEVAALGCNVNWGDAHSMPESGKPIWSGLSDIRIPDNFLSHPACATPLRSIAMLKKRLGNSAAVCGKVFGSWTLSYHLFGVENFLMSTIDDPDATRVILEKLLPVTIAFARAQVEAGADCIVLADHATRDLCSPQAYQEFLAPLHERLACEIPAPIILHICGNTSDRIAMIAKTGLACFHWDTKSGHPAAIRKMAGENLALMGGISNLTLLSGTPGEVAEMASQAVRSGIDVIGPECAIPLATPLRNLQAIAQVRR